MPDELPRSRRTLSLTLFLLLTFTATYAVEIWLIHSGVRFDAGTVQSTPALWLLAVMWIPGLSALLTVLCVERSGLRGLPTALLMRLGSMGPYGLTLLLIPGLFAAMYGLTWALGLASPDTTMRALIEATGHQESITPDTVFRIMLPLSVVLGPLINFAFGLGEELGWRGFLLPRLLFLGRVRAHLVVGVLWGMWHAPLIWAGFNYPGHPVAGVAMMCVLTTAFGLFLGEMTLHYRSVLLAAFIHGAVNAQGYGIWSWLFPGTDPLLGGGTGLTGVAVWLVTGVITLHILGRLKRNQGVLS